MKHASSSFLSFNFSSSSSLDPATYFLTREKLFSKIVNLQSLDVDEFLQTHMSIHQNLTTTLHLFVPNEQVNTVANVSMNQPTKVSENSETSSLHSDGGGKIPYRSEDFLLYKKQQKEEKDV